MFKLTKAAFITKGEGGGGRWANCAVGKRLIRGNILAVEKKTNVFDGLAGTTRCNFGKYSEYEKSFLSCSLFPTIYLSNWFRYKFFLRSRLSRVICIFFFLINTCLRKKYYKSR